MGEGEKAKGKESEDRGGGALLKLRKSKTERVGKRGGIQKIREIERERVRERQTDRQIDRQTETETEAELAR